MGITRPGKRTPLSRPAETPGIFMSDLAYTAESQVYGLMIAQKILAQRQVLTHHRKRKPKPSFADKEEVVVGGGIEPPTCGL